MTRRHGMPCTVHDVVCVVVIPSRLLSSLMPLPLSTEEHSSVSSQSRKIMVFVVVGGVRLCFFCDAASSSRASVEELGDSQSVSAAIGGMMKAWYY